MSEQKTNTAQTILDTVRTGYAAIATQTASSCCSRRSGQAEPEKLAKAIGYSEEALKRVPEGANLGVSCGNPLAVAQVREGQVVLDLGSGAGFDAFQAGALVKNSGRVIGVDMTPEMLSRARKNIAKYNAKFGLDNVEFRLGEIEHLPVADNSVDVVISNCVINLSPDKPQVWREIRRVLKPGGLVSVSDLVKLKPLPEAVDAMAAALVG